MGVFLEKYNIIKIQDRETILAICEKLRYIKNTGLTESSLFKFIYFAKQNANQDCCYATFDGDKMTSSAVIYLAKNLKEELTLFLVFIWIDPHYSELWKEYITFLNEKAKELKAKRISFTTARNEEAILRKYAKYGYKKVYNVIEKEVN